MRKIFTAARILSLTALALLCAYQWPGNVRELAHVLERGVAAYGSNLGIAFAALLMFANPFLGQIAQERVITLGSFDFHRRHTHPYFPHQ